MDYILLALLIVLIVIVLLMWLLPKKQEDISQIDLNEQNKQAQELKLYFQKEYGDLKFDMQKLFHEHSKISQEDLSKFKDGMMNHIDAQLKSINEKVENRLGEGFEKTNKTFVNVIERLTKIDEAQKTIESLSKEVVSLNTILTDKKTRGVFGEVQLYQLLEAVLGNQRDLYERQKTLSNNAIADVVVYAPDPIGMIAIDSKFPLDNYRRMVDRNLSEIERKTHEKDFKNDIKKHINDIKNKYIIHGETAGQAFMFVPAEAIFAELNAYHPDLIEYALKNDVWITSPTTLISTLTMIQMAVKDIQRNEQAQIIVKELMDLGKEFERYGERWDKLRKDLTTVTQDADKVHITSRKINKKFKYISEAKFDEIELFEAEDEEIDKLE
ncbi:MAG: DNA recombination protein RmuC [Acholeplasmataceae bacterium]